MMAEMPDSALACPTLSDGAKSVLAALWRPVQSQRAMAVRAGEGMAEVSLTRETLMARTGKSLAAVKRALKDLRNHGLIVRGQVMIQTRRVLGWHLANGPDMSRSSVGDGGEREPVAGSDASRYEREPVRTRAARRLGREPGTGSNANPEAIAESVIESVAAASAPAEDSADLSRPQRRVRLGAHAARLARKIHAAQRGVDVPRRCSLNVEAHLLESLCKAEYDPALAVKRVETVVDSMCELLATGNREVRERWGDRAFSPYEHWFTTTEALVTRLRTTGGARVADDGFALPPTKKLPAAPGME